MTPDPTTRERNDALLAWYRREARDLPWRRVVDPYRTLVSETMLQQTQFERVVPKFEEFTHRWPTVEDLATADTTEVLTVWSGLGYNSRALRLVAAARRIVDTGWPTTREGLEELPGVGPYTSAAIASIAFGATVPAVDTNLRRVLSRWVGRPLDPRSLSTVAAALCGEPAGDWNQAVMDLGATRCRPKDPSCDGCPVSTWCGDPSVYVRPPRQGAFAGSVRELRGALVRAHLAGEDVREAGRALGRSDDEIDRTLRALVDEGLIATSAVG